jgi:hypothetical protein
MNSSNKNIPNYTANSRGNKRGGKGEYNSSNIKSESKIETANTQNKPNSSAHTEQKESEANIKMENSFAKNSSSNTTNTILPQTVSSPTKKLSKSKKFNIDVENLPDLNSSSQKNADVSVNESKGDIDADTSLISEDTRAAVNNDNDKSLLSVENFDLVNKNETSRKQSVNVQVNAGNNRNSKENVIDLTVKDEVKLNLNGNDKNDNEEEKEANDPKTEEKTEEENQEKIEEKKDKFDNKINEVKIEVKVTVENLKEDNVDKGLEKNLI